MERENYNTEHLMQISQFPNCEAAHFYTDRIVSSVAMNMSFSHFHDYYEIYYLVSGERYYFIKDKSYHIKSGELVLIKPYEIHMTRSSADKGYDRILLYFNKEYLKNFTDAIPNMNLFACFEKDIPVIRLNLQEQPFVQILLTTMLREFADKNADNALYLKASLMQLLLMINKHKERLIEDDCNYINASHKTVSEIAGYINNNYYEPITLSSIANRFFISPCYLSRTFKKITGFTFVEYLNGVRIKEAQKLLHKTNLHVSEISEKVGYKSTTHFGRIFKNITGTSPLLYRKIQNDNFHHDT